MRRVVLALVLAGLLLSPPARAAAPSDATVLRRHLPVLVLHPAERFPPVAVDAFLAAADRLVRRADGT